jgi:large subunit ribosomal protein L25
VIDAVLRACAQRAPLPGSAGDGFGAVGDPPKHCRNTAAADLDAARIEEFQEFPVSEVKISAEPRTEFGKGGARRTRRAGLVPAVLYGHGEAPQHIALPAREFAAAIRHGGLNQIFTIDIAGNAAATLALPKAIQRDPIKDTYEHIDLLIVKKGEKIQVDVPVTLTGEAAKNTLITHESNTVAVIADALHLPSELELPIDGLDAGSRLTAGDVKLPTGVELAVDAETVLATINAAQSTTTAAEDEAAAGESTAEVAAE